MINIREARLGIPSRISLNTRIMGYFYIDYRLQLNK
jgi:hypothetical protein